jgi:hypothetical protein
MDWEKIYEEETGNPARLNKFPDTNNSYHREHFVLWLKNKIDSAGVVGLSNGVRPPIVCLCGSTRFYEAFRQANLRETLAGNIVLSIGCDFKSDDALGLTDMDKERLDELHKRKIDLADEILVLNVGGYIGSSTKSEIEYAIKNKKRVRYLEAA